MFYKGPLLCFLLIGALAGYGQLYPYRHFTTNDGLINNRCGNVSQDSAGYIWITSDNGICNYDGRKFTFFPGKRSTYYFSHTNTINMYKGQCVMATEGEGIAMGLGNKLTFYSPPLQANSQISYGLFLNDSSSLIAKIFSSDLELVSGSRKTVISAPPGFKQKIKTFLMFLKDAEGNIWVGTDAGVYVYANGNFNDPYVIPALYGKYCNVLKADFAGNIFIACEYDVFKVFRQQLKKIKAIQPVKFATHNANITAMGFFRNGDIMVSDLPYGIAIYNKALGLKKKLSKHGLPDVLFWDIFVDREENIWFATENGIYRFSNFDFVNYIPQQVTGAPNIKSGIAYKDDFVFSNGLGFFNAKEKTIEKIQSSANTYGVKIIATPGNGWWVNAYTDRNLQPSVTTKVVDIVSGRVIEKKQVSYAGYANGVIDMDKVAMLNNKEMAFLTTDKKLLLGRDDKVEPILLPPGLDTLNFNAIGSGFREDEIILAANKTGLFYCMLEKVPTGSQLQIMEHIPFDTTLQYDRCLQIVAARDKKIWLATRNNGIRIFSRVNYKYMLLKSIGEPLISSNFITTLLEDSSGNMWIGSNKGIDKASFTRQANVTINKGLFNNLMIGRYIFFLKEHLNKLYIGTTGGLSVTGINPKLSTPVPPVYISHLYVNNKNADSLLGQQPYTFSPSENNITFEFVSPTFIDEQQTEYQYQLQGINKEWSTPAGNYTIAYSQLPAGDYTFRVRAKNANSVWSLTDAGFSFTIKKPFYKHWLFFVLCAAFAIALGYWLYRQKMNKVLAIERTRRSISKDLHDDIGTTLSSITLMNAVLKNKIESQPGEAKKMAAKIETASRDMIQNMSDIVWSINPNNDTMEKLIYRLQQFCNDVFDIPGIQYQLIVEEAVKSKVLNMQLRRDLYLICKEIINNAAKYSRAASFRLTLALVQKNMVLTAMDDGIGFDEKTANKGNGLTNIRQRVNTHNGDVKLATGNGTTWHISIPV